MRKTLDNGYFYGGKYEFRNYQIGDFIILPTHYNTGENGTDLEGRIVIAKSKYDDILVVFYEDNLIKTLVINKKSQNELLENENRIMMIRGF